MEVHLVGAALVAIVIFAPILMQQYLQRLPIAPACPSCRAIAHEVNERWSAALILPSLSTTFRARCARCGWRGRMRWRWAPRSVRGED